MEIGLFLILFIIFLLYILKPVTKIDEKIFNNKNNWRGGF